MSHATRLQFEQVPSTLSQAFRGLFSRTTNNRNPQLPSIDAVIYGLKPEKSNVKAYADICGFGETKGKLPLTYPHILAFKLHMELMLHHSFPLAVMGMVHVSNTITQHRAIGVDEVLDIRAFFTEGVRTDKGLEVYIRSEVRVGMDLVWEDSSTYLAILPSKGGSKKKGAKERPALPVHASKESWILPSNLGMRYGKISGDPNPIHMNPYTAKLFGFKRHIAHGMWTKARVAAALYRKLGSESCSLTIDFKLPIFLPGQVELQFTPEGDAIDFDVRDMKGEKLHLKGQIKKV